MTAAAILDAAPTPNTPEWEAWRHGGIGTSEIPAILGEDPRMTERALALEKKGLVPPRQPDAAMDWGHRVEEMGASLYAERTGRELVIPGTLVDPRWPHVFTTPDRLVVGERRLVELKWTNHWSEPPRRVVIQGQGQMGIADADVVDVVVMGPYGEPHFHEIERDDRDILALLNWAEEWYLTYCLGDELPPIDGSGQTRRHLASAPRSGTMQATDEQDRLMASLRQARADQDAAEHEEALISNLLMASMTGHDYLEGDGWHVTWKQAKGATRVEWAAIADVYARTVDSLVRELRAHQPDVALEGIDVSTDEGLARVHEALRSIYTRTGNPTHPFKPHWG